MCRAKNGIVQFSYCEISIAWFWLFPQPADQVADAEQIEAFAMEEIFVFLQAESWTVAVNWVGEVDPKMNCHFPKKLIPVISGDVKVRFKS